MKIVLTLLLLPFLFLTAFSQQNVGIGISNPKARLQISGSSSYANPGLLINSADANGANYIKFERPGLRDYNWSIMTRPENDPTGQNSGMFFYHGVDSINSLVKIILNLRGSGRVGIGNVTPTNPLTFMTTLEKKISLYPGATGDAGFGVFANELRQYIDDNNGKITFGFDNFNNGFTEYMRLSNGGNLGIGTNQPKARLQVADSAVLFTGPATEPPITTSINPPLEGEGTRMMWFSPLGALRAGYVSGTSWDRDNIGRLSFAGGRDAIAIGITSFSFGNYTNAGGNSSFSSGSYTIASGDVATAMGRSSSAVGRTSFSVGNNCISKASGSTVLGAFNDDTDNPDPINENSTDRIFQLGNGDRLSHFRSNALTVLRNGNTGIGVLDPAFLLDVGARMRLRATPGLSAGTWLNNDANNASNAFIGMRSDLEVGFYGQTGTYGWRFYVNTSSGNAYLQGILTQSSDARLKTNIQPLSSTLPSLLKINGYTYSWRDQTADPDLQIGLLAQEVKQYFPELVKQNDKGFLSVNYNGMIPVLLEAVKELNTKNQHLESQMEVLSAKLATIISRLEMLESK